MNMFIKIYNLKKVVFDVFKWFEKFLKMMLIIILSLIYVLNGLMNNLILCWIDIVW